MWKPRVSRERRAGRRPAERRIVHLEGCAGDCGAMVVYAGELLPVCIVREYGLSHVEGTA